MLHQVLQKITPLQEEIVNHPWFTEWLPESWEDEETRNEICVTFYEVPVDEEEKKEFFEKYTNSS